MKQLTLFIAGVSTLILLAVGLSACAGDDTASKAANVDTTEQAAATCSEEARAGWEELADRIGAPVYCPSWLPAPLTNELGGEWHSTDSVRRDGSYLMGFIWFEPGSGEVHVNLRAYPGQTDMPDCDGRPCFSDPQAPKQIGSFDITPYSVNRGADTWHLLYAWEHDGSLYSVSQHVVPDLGLSYGQVAANLDRIMRGLELIEPSSS